MMEKLDGIKDMTGRGGSRHPLVRARGFLQCQLAKESVYEATRLATEKEGGAPKKRLRDEETEGFVAVVSWLRAHNSSFLYFFVAPANRQADASHGATQQKKEGPAKKPKHELQNVDHVRVRTFAELMAEKRNGKAAP